MSERRWPLLVAALVAVIALVAGAWAAGRASAPSRPAAGGTTTPASGSPVRIIGGVPVGVEHSRAGALAAADNYVARSSETIVQDPKAYAELVRVVFAPEYQGQALREGQRSRERSPDAVANYAAGGRGLAVLAARRLDSYDGRTAQTTTWAGGLVWGPDQRPKQRWFLTETTLRWDGQRWRVTKMKETTRPAPAPAIVAYDDPDALKLSTFDRELRGMAAPTYGAGG